MKILFTVLIISFTRIGYTQSGKFDYHVMHPVFKQVSYPFLPVSTSNAIFFSNDGLMWFSCSEGLVSFDGSGVVYHSNTEEANKFGLNSIYAFTEDARHNFYIGTGSGLIYFNRKEKSFLKIGYLYNDNKQEGLTNIRSLYIDSNDGKLFAGGINIGLFIYDPTAKKIEHFNMDPNKPDSWQDKYGNSITGFLTNRQDSSSLWIGSYNGIFQFNKFTKKFSQKFSIVNQVTDYLGKPSEVFPVEQMDMQNDSTIWFNFYFGALGHYNTHTGKAYIDTNYWRSPKNKTRNGLIIPAFAKMNDSLYLLGIKNMGPAIYNTRNSQLNFFKLNQDYNSFDAVVNVVKDPVGNIWIKSSGIWNVSVPTHFRLQTKKLQPDDLNMGSAELRGIYFDTISHLYYSAVRISTGVHVLDSNFNFIKIIPTPLFSNYYTNNRTCTDRIIKDGSGRFWTTGWETYIMPPGKNKFDYAEKVYPTLAWLKTKGEFFDMIASNNGDILLAASNTRTVYCINHKTLHTDSIRVPQFSNTLKNSISFSLLSYDAMRNFLYLSNDDGIAQVDLENKKTSIISSQEIFGTNTTGQRILEISIDCYGRLWLLKENYGVRIIDPTTLKCIDSVRTGTRGLINGYYVSLAFGGKDCMLFQSRSGIIIYNYEKQYSFVFDATNGLSFPEQPAMLYTNHHMVVGLRNRIQFYDTRELNKINFHTVPQITTISVDTSVVFTRESFAQNEIVLKHKQNNFVISFSAPELIFPERIEYAYRLEDLNADWQYTGYLNGKVTYTNLTSGKYVFHLKAQVRGGNWDGKEILYTITINPAWWQTVWFKIATVLGSLLLIIYFTQRRIQFVRKTEQQKSRHQKELTELEAKALRAQMNPHFIFNCLNSIKSLIQENEKSKSVTYLTTFSKLIRTLFNNADKKEISLFDEIETCKYYLQLESMRFGTKFSYLVTVDPDIDLKSIYVPALIIQPFIENAIWHGIVPRSSGGNISLVIARANEAVEIIIDDDGIGRVASRQNKPSSSIGHQSKGVNLTQSRLELNNLLQQRQATLEIIDKKDKNEIAKGTTVIIKIKEDAL